MRFEKRVVCFVGNNGIGKTNLLDAIYYLCLCKSYFNATEKLNIKHEEKFFTIQGNFIKESNDFEVFCAYRAGEKKRVKCKGVEYEKLSEHIGKFPLVMVTPGDLELVTAYGDERRKFVDSIIAQFDAAYLEQLIIYNKVLNQRNALLKQFAERGSFNADLLDTYDEQIKEVGTFLFQKRKDFIVEFEPILQSFYDLITEGKEKISISYQTNLHEKSMEALLKENRNKDRMVQRTTEGIHRDDFELLINGFSVKKFGSQGQQKSFIFALKLAQYKMIEKNHVVKPILLLDDIFDRLDNERMFNLMQIFKNGFGQIFITDTQAERVQELYSELELDFEVFKMNDLEKE